MAVKYVKDFSFPASGGFHGSVQRYAKGGHVTKVPAKAKASAKDMPARAKPNAPAKGASKMESKPKMGKGQGYAEGGRVPGYDMDRLPAKKPPGRTMDLAPSKPERGQYQGYAKGGKAEKFARGGINIPREVPPSLQDAYRNARLGISASGRQAVPSTHAQAMNYLESIAQKGLARAPAPVKSSALKVLGKAALRGVPYLGAAYTAYDLGKMAYDAAQDAKKSRKIAPANQIEVDEPGYARGGRIAPPVVSRSAPSKITPLEGSDPFSKISKIRNAPVLFNKRYAKGGKVSKVMSEYKEGKLHSGSKKGPLVKNREQAIAIALSEARKAGAKIPKKAEGGIFSTESMAYQSKGPKTRYTPAKGRREARERAMERRAREAMERAEKFAPGMSLDMPDRRSKGGMPRR